MKHQPTDHECHRSYSTARHLQPNINYRKNNKTLQNMKTLMKSRPCKMTDNITEKVKTGKMLMQQTDTEQHELQ